MTDSFEGPLSLPAMPGGSGEALLSSALSHGVVVNLEAATGVERHRLVSAVLGGPQELLEGDGCPLDVALLMRSYLAEFTQPSVDWVDPGWLPPSSGSVGQVEICGPRRSCPNFDVEHLEPATQQRWAASSWGEDPGAFDIGKMVSKQRDATGLDEARLRRPSIAELERLWGFEAGHTASAIGSSSLKSAAGSLTRRKLVSQGLQVALCAPLLKKILDEWSLLSPPAETTTLPDVHWRGWSLEERLVVDHLRSVDHRGSDVRLDAGTLMSPSSWPRRSLRPHLWRWQTKFAWSWTSVHEHINLLEARATLNAIRWRLRSRIGIGKKHLHLVDSQVVQAVVTKHRSSSKVLNRICRTNCALELASHTHLLVGFVRSDLNPADAPTRDG